MMVQRHELSSATTEQETKMISWLRRLFSASRSVEGQRELTEVQANLASVDERESYIAHTALYGNATTYFVWTQGTAGPLDLGRSVQRILKAELATSAAWPSEPQARLSPSIAKLDSALIRLNTMHLILDQNRALRSRLKITILHPVTAVIAMYFSLRARYLERRAGKVSKGHADKPDMDGTLADMREAMIDLQKVSLVERELDSRLFGGETQNDDHYVRLLLRPFEVKLEGALDGHRSLVEPRLLLHREGAVQLTLGLHLPPGRSTEDLIETSYSSNEIISQVVWPEPYVNIAPQKFHGTWSEGWQPSMRNMTVEHEERTSLAELVELIMTGVIRMARAKLYGEWNCYPIVLAEAGECCQEWEQAHGNELPQIAVRARGSARIEVKNLAGADLSSRRDQSHWANEGSGLVFYRKGWKPGISDLNITLLHEHIMLVYSRLKRLERTVRTFPTTERAVAQLYKVALQLAPETRGASIRYGTARNINQYLLAALGVPEMRASIDQGLNMLGELASLQVGKAQARVANFLALSAVALAVVAAVPAVPAVIDIIGKQQQLNPEVGFWSVASEALTSPLRLSLIALIAVAAVMLIVSIKLIYNAAMGFDRKKKRGYKARAVPLGFTIVDAKENSGQQDDPTSRST